MRYNAISKNRVVEKGGKFLSDYILVSEHLIKVISKIVITSLFDVVGFSVTLFYGLLMQLPKGGKIILYY